MKVVPHVGGLMLCHTGSLPHCIHFSGLLNQFISKPGIVLSTSFKMLIVLRQLLT